MLISYTKDEFPTDYVPTIFDNYAANLTVDGKSVSLQLWDTAGEDYAKLRPMSYPDTNVFLLAFAVNSRTSLDNITNIWYTEVHNAVPSAQIILVGMKSDLREKAGEDCVSSEEIQRICNKIKAVKYIECSALTRHNVSEVFNSVILTYLKPPKKETKKTEKTKNEKCIIN